jgi:succinyldiaminopimelate transaminase
MAFVPPPYPHDRLGPVREAAAAVPGGMVDASVGTPVDPMPDVVVRALADAAPGATGYPPTIGSLALREAAAAWIARRFGCGVTTDEVIPCIGTKELVASLPRVLSLRDPSRDTVLYPAVAYPTYAMGARLGGLRPVPVPVDEGWYLDLARVDPADAARALVLWLNDPGNPTGVTATPARMRDAVEWARARGVVVASDECYAEFTYDADGVATTPVTALDAGTDGVLAVHSLSKRSNMAGMRSGFVAGDRALVGYLGEVRKHGGLMMPAPVQAATVAALGDDEHVAEQRARYARRRAVVLPALEARGLAHDGGSSTFYLWLRDPDRGRDGWAIADDLATTGLVVAPGDFYGDASTDHVRVALTLTDDQVALVADRATAGINA